MAIIQLIYQQVENYIVYPIVYRRAVELSPFTTIVAVLIAGSILGVLGAILAVPFAAIVKIVLHEGSRPRRERMAAPARGYEAAARSDLRAELVRRGADSAPAAATSRRSRNRTTVAVE